MTTVDDAVASPFDPRSSLDAPPPDRRHSPIPTFGMIASRFTELRKRRGLMITLALVTIGIPVLFLAIRLIAHAAAPKTYGPAGGYDIYTAMVSGVLYTFGFIVAAALGATAGSSDLTEGMFRHEVVTGRSRLGVPSRACVRQAKVCVADRRSRSSTRCTCACMSASRSDRWARPTVSARAGPPR